jgi:hypothetical protein
MLAAVLFPAVLSLLVRLVIVLVVPPNSVAVLVGYSGIMMWFSEQVTLLVAAQQIVLL